MGVDSGFVTSSFSNLYSKLKAEYFIYLFND